MEMIYREKVNELYPTYVGCNLIVALPQSEKDKYDFSHVGHVWTSGSAWHQ